MSDPVQQQRGQPVRKTAAGRFRAAVDRALRHPITDTVVMALVLTSVALLLVEAYGLVSGSALEVVELAGEVITVAFLVELSLRWWVAPSTRGHFREYWLDWLSVLPMLRPVRVLRVLRILRALRLLRLYRFGAMAQRFVAGTEHHRFEQMLRSEIAHYRGRFADQVWLVPELFRMLTNMLEDGRVGAESRRLITAALAYFITPFELLPKELHGPEGYLDQVYLCLWVVKKLRESLPDHVLEGAWDGEGEILEIVERELAPLETELEPQQVHQVLGYLGLRPAQPECP